MTLANFKQKHYIADLPKKRSQNPAGARSQVEFSLFA